MIKKLKKTPEQKRFWANVEACAKEVKSWPKWRQDEAKEWLAGLERTHEFYREYNRTLGQQ